MTLALVKIRVASFSRIGFTEALLPVEVMKVCATAVTLTACVTLSGTSAASTGIENGANEDDKTAPVALFKKARRVFFSNFTEDFCTMLKASVC